MWLALAFLRAEQAGDLGAAITAAEMQHGHRAFMAACAPARASGRVAPEPERYRLKPDSFYSIFARPRSSGSGYMNASAGSM